MKVFGLACCLLCWSAGAAGAGLFAQRGQWEAAFFAALFALTRLRAGLTLWKEGRPDG